MVGFALSGNGWKSWSHTVGHYNNSVQPSISVLLWILAGLVVVGGLVLFYWIGARGRAATKDPQEVRDAFQSRRSELQAAFFAIASQSGKPRGLRWKECQWNELLAWARDRGTGQLLALVGVTIAFEAIEGGDMEGVEAVGNLRNATAVFYFDGAEWRTVGRVVFNLNPVETIAHFQNAYERLS